MNADNTTDHGIENNTDSFIKKPFYHLMKDSQLKKLLMQYELPIQNSRKVIHMLIRTA